MLKFKTASLAGLFALFLALPALADLILDTALASFTEAIPISQDHLASPTEIRAIAITPTFLFTRENNQLWQLARLKLENGSGKNLAVGLRIERPEGLMVRTDLNLAPGRSETMIKIPDLRKPAEITLTLSCSGQEPIRYTLEWQPARLWEVHLTQLSHFDWGYTGTQEEVRQVQNQVLDTVIEYSRRTADWPEDARFRWTVDGSFTVMNYLQDHPGRELDLRDLVASGRMEINAKLGHLCPSTAGYEMLARELYYSTRDLRQLLGADPVTAIHTDVPGITWGDATVLAGAGVKYLLFHPNRMYRGGAVMKNTRVPQAFYWQGPDGSRLLTWRSYDSYTEATFLINGIEQTAKELPALLLEREKTGYPFDLLHLTRSGKDPKTQFDDNSPPRIEICYSIREWNARFAYPRLIAGLPRTFFAELERRYGDQIPTYAGDMPDWWADGVLTNAEETKLSRQMHHDLREAELWSSLAGLLSPDFSYPGQTLDQAHLANWIYDEHTWGYMFPFLPREEKIWNYKRGALRQGVSETAPILAQALKTLADTLGEKDTWVVFNPLEWPRTEPVRLDLGPQSRDPDSRLKVALEDVQTGEIFIGQAEPGSSSTAFPVKDVPALGYRTFRMVPAPPSQPAAESFQVSNRSIENSLFILKFDAQGGGLTSLYDKRLGRELLDGKAEYALGQPLARGQGYFDWYDRRAPAQVEKITVSSPGPVYALATVIYRLRGFASTRIKTEFKIYHDLPYLDLVSSFNHYRNGPGASKYLAFPFAVPDPEFYLEIPYSIMRPGQDQLPDFATYYAVSHSVLIQSGQGFGIAWSTREGPMVELSDIRKQAGFANPYSAQFDQPPPRFDRGHVYSELMNNFQNTNYHYWQRGSGAWSYRISSLSADPSRSEAVRPGWELAQPLLAWQVKTNPNSTFPPAASLIALSPGSVLLVTMKRAEDSQGTILRLYESEGKAVQARLRLPLAPITHAVLTDITEHDRQELPVRDGAVTLDLGPFSVRTLRVMTEAKGKL